MYLLTMEEQTLSEKLKECGIGATEISQRLGISRQSVYNYIQYYESGDAGKIPYVIRRLIEIYDGEGGRDEAIRYWNEKTGGIGEQLMIIETDTDKVDEMQMIALSLREKYVNSGSSDDRKELECYIRELNNLKEEIVERKMTVARQQKRLLESNYNDTIAQISARDRRRNPAWEGDAVKTVCVSNGDEYMIIVKGAEVSALTKVEIYTMIDDENVLLETHDIPKGGNALRIRLPPKLKYAFRAMIYSENGFLSSEMRELTNYLRSQLPR